MRLAAVRAAVEAAAQRASPSSTSPPTRRGARRRQVPPSLRSPLEVVDAIALCNRRIEVVGTDLYKVTQEVTEAVSVMVASKSLEGGSMEAVLSASGGVWEVFHASHMARMSSPLGVSFKPCGVVS